MNKLFFLFIFLIITILKVIAIPADGVFRNIVQPDGTVLSICVVGDEFAHYVLSMDGCVLWGKEDEGYSYAIMHDGRLCASDVLAHNPDLRGKQEIEFVTERLKAKTDSCIVDKLHQKRNSIIKKVNVKRMNMKNHSLGVPMAFIGDKKGLVILVNFANLAMSSETAHDDYNRMFNEKEYTGNGCIGSVHDYFFDQSYGKFNLTFDVVGPVTVSRNYGYYGSDYSETAIDVHVREMVTEACKLADNFVDFGDYDWDNDGIVDQVFLVYAGSGQATGGASNTIWPHESYLSENIELDGVRISQYACSNELYGNGVGKNILMGIGCACHEFSHCLGLPDLYDTDYSGAFGMSYWDVMNSGSYNGPCGVGEIPCGYSAFERWFAGWLTFNEVNTSQHIASLLSLDDYPVAYKIVNEGNENEFFTLENRQPTKWFKYVDEYEGLHGLLITHIDYDVNAWMSNKVNPNSKHQRMSPIVADNSYGRTYNDFAGDLFPGMANVTWLTNESHASSGGKLFNRNTDGTYNMNRAIGNITENEDGIISFDVIFNNDVPAPIISDATEITQEGYTANWESVEDADYYIIEQTSIDFTNIFFPVRKTETVNPVYGTSQQMKWLTQKGRTNYHVRSVVNGIMSEWSDNKSVEYIPETGIVDLKEINKDNVKYYGINGVANKRMRHGVNIIQSGGHTSKLYMK
ncbi:MAG: M6 family metalloprotease domain-containing protein [Prevotella sp.]|nr:M6 family metalloprotease domain-containing protein [Prevotella sp.]